MNGYKMSMITKSGHRDYYGEFRTKEEAIEMANNFIVLNSNYVDYEVWYFEK